MREFLSNFPQKEFAAPPPSHLTFTFTKEKISRENVVYSNGDGCTTPQRQLRRGCSAVEVREIGGVSKAGTSVPPGALRALQEDDPLQPPHRRERSLRRRLRSLRRRRFRPIERRSRSKTQFSCLSMARPQKKSIIHILIQLISGR